MVALGLYFVDDLIPTFGGKGAIFDPAKIYYTIILYGVPFLALCMMGNTVIRAEGKPKFAMIAMIIPSVGNLFLDYLFIYVFDWGMHGAAWATTAGYLLCFGYILYFFLSKNSELKIALPHFGLSMPILQEIGGLGFVTLARQAVTSITYLADEQYIVQFGWGGHGRGLCHHWKDVDVCLFPCFWGHPRIFAHCGIQLWCCKVRSGKGIHLYRNKICSLCGFASVCCTHGVS